MGRLAAPMISRAHSARSLSASPFNEGISVPQGEWDAAVRRNPELEAKDKATRAAAMKREITQGELAKFRRR